MFNVGPMELILILLVALVVVGPKRLPEVGRTIGRSLRELRRATEDVRSSFEASLDDDERHADGDVASFAMEEPSENGAEAPRHPSASAHDDD